MKKVMFMLLVAFMFVSCGTKAAEVLKNDGVVDKSYKVGKVVYKLGKKVVPLIPMSEATKSTLQSIDVVAVSYDDARTEIRGQLAKKPIADGDSKDTMEFSLYTNVITDHKTKEIK